MPRRQLPGLRWDNDKQRYFPLALAVQPDKSTQTATLDTEPRPRRLSSYHALARLRSVCHTVHKDALIQSVPLSPF